MTDSPYLTALLDVLDQTFSSLAFMMAMPPDMAEEGPAGPWVAAEVRFEGPATGAVFLRVQEKMLLPLASNMLGMDFDEAPPNAEQQRDALKEIINVVCGNLLPELAGVEAVFNVHAPVLLEGKDLPDTYEGKPIDCTARMLFDEGWAETAFCMHGEVSAPAE
jgi:CheY-specific phosphatase CheX